MKLQQVIFSAVYKFLLELFFTIPTHQFMMNRKTVSSKSFWKRANSSLIA